MAESGQAMILVVLRSLIVYGATAAACLLLVHRFVTPLRRKTAILLACAPALLVGKALLTGGVYAPLDVSHYFDRLAIQGAGPVTVGVRTPLVSDVVFTYVPGVKAVREAVKNGRLPLWNRFHAAGEPLLAFQQPAIFHPATWIGFLLPLAQAWTFGIALRFLVALLSAYAFFRELRCGELPSLLGAAAWAFCDHVVFFVGFSVGAAVAPFPLLLLGLRRLVRDADRTAAGITVAALTLITVAGHPETLLHCVAGGGVYFLIELASAKRRLKPLGLALLAGALTLGLTAVVLLPFREILPVTQQAVSRQEIYAKQKKSVEVEFAAYRSMRNLLPFGVGLGGRAPGREPVQLPASYAGSMILPLVVVGLFSSRREKWAFVVLTFLGLALWARVEGITDVVTSLPLLDIALNDYLVFLAAFGAVALAVLGAQSLEEGRHSAVFVGAALATAGALWLVHVHVLARSDLDILVNVPNPLRRSLALCTVPLVAAAAAMWALRRRSGTLRVGALLLLFLVQRGLEAGPIYRTFPNRAFYPPLDVLEGLPRSAPERIVGVGHILIPNVSSLYELEDVRAYEPMTLGAFQETYPLWCVAQPIWHNRVDDLKRPFLSFLNVRHAITPLSSEVPSGWRVVREGSGLRVLENPGALPRAFVPSSIRFEENTERQLEILNAIEDFRREGVVGAPGPPGWSGNGGADIRVTAYTGQAMSLRIDAPREALVATSIPGWPGWRLRVDGLRAPLLPYNRAFLAFRVPAGSHEARLEYLPEGFVRGAAISGATIALLGVLLLRGPAKRARGPASAR